ncbi:ABC transporter ATP-binding protein, partial [Lachnospiraceae bacterium OttesenSCG-928-D06]|nr:ABC transporter ATP-binding protein [Lachnospiraceae bacterium OttesenSCG-928-D06]
MITINNINKKYKNKQVLFDFSLKIEDEKNSIYGLVGPNGAGKTTILKVITGLLEYTSGTIEVEGELDYWKWCHNNIVLVPAGERGLRYKNTVYDNVLFFSAMKGVAEKIVIDLIHKYAKILKFTDFLNRRVETLSMGQKKKAMLLCGLCTDMKIIIMDEPSNGLDVDAQIEMKLLIKKISDECNRTFIVSSHDLDFLSDVANHYIFMF